MDRILIVDDDSSIRALTVGILRRAGYETVEAEDGEAVLDLLDQDQRFSLIISDIYMPRMTGISLLKELQKCCPHIPVIISSVDSIPEVIHTAIQEGALYYLPRPFTANQLMNAVRRVQNARL